jgi:glycerol-1-phosphatase
MSMLHQHGGPLAGRYDALIVDLDGVLYRGNERIDGAPDVIERVHGLGTPLLFVTNNSSRTPEQVAERLRSLGFRAEPREVLTSAMATAAMLRREGSEGRTAFVVGERGIREALADAGIRVLDGEPGRADMVIVGWDRSADYDKLRTAALLVQRGARLVATNADASYPAPDGLWPGAGALLAAITTTTGATPVVVGKPAPPMLEAAAELTGAHRPLLVGDRPETDIGGAASVGWDSLLVFSGVATPADLLWTPALPTYVGSDISAVLRDLPAARFRTAAEGDVPAIEALLEASGLSTTRVADRLDSTVVCAAPGDSGHLLATAALELAGDYPILRSVAVEAGSRGTGLGQLAVAHAVRHARALDARLVALFTESAAAFFAKLGFNDVSRHRLPEPVRNSRHASEECATIAGAMTLELDRAPHLPSGLGTDQPQAPPT